MPNTGGNIWGLRYDYIMDEGHILVLYRDDPLTFSDLSDLQVQMLQSNRMPNILPFEKFEKNDEVMLYYRFTGMRRLSDVLKLHPLKLMDYYQLLHHIVSVLLQSNNYMLRYDQYILDDHFIYVDEQNKRVHLCYLPLTSLKNKLSVMEDLEKLAIHLVTYVEDHVGHQLWAFIQMLREPQCTLFAVKKTLDQLRWKDNHQVPPLDASLAHDHNVEISETMQWTEDHREENLKERKHNVDDKTRTIWPFKKSVDDQNSSMKGRHGRVRHDKRFGVEERVGYGERYGYEERVGLSERNEYEGPVQYSERFGYDGQVGEQSVHGLNAASENKDTESEKQSELEVGVRLRGYAEELSELAGVMRLRENAEDLSELAGVMRGFGEQNLLELNGDTSEYDGESLPYHQDGFGMRGFAEDYIIQSGDKAKGYFSVLTSRWFAYPFALCLLFIIVLSFVINPSEGMIYICLGCAGLLADMTYVWEKFRIRFVGDMGGMFRDDHGLQIDEHASLQLDERSDEEYFAQLSHMTTVLSPPDRTIVLNESMQERMNNEAEQRAAKRNVKQQSYLEIEVGGQRERINLDEPTFIIGRDNAACHGMIDPLGVSRRHCDLTCKDAEWCIQDLASRNGTALNGTTLVPYKWYELEDGDEITCVSNKFVFRKS